MLKIHISQCTKDCISDVEGYFHVHQDKNWFNRVSVKEIIRKIDHVKAGRDGYLDSPKFGIITPDRLSTSCKTLILLQILDNPNVLVGKCAENCAANILEIAGRKDITITLNYAMEFPDKFDAYIIESDTMIHSGEEFAKEFTKNNFE